MCMSMYSEVPTQSTSVVIWNVNQKPRTTHTVFQVTTLAEWIPASNECEVLFFDPLIQKQGLEWQIDLFLYSKRWGSLLFSHSLTARVVPLGATTLWWVFPIQCASSWGPSSASDLPTLMSKGCQGRADLLRRLLFHSFISEDFSYFLGRSVVLSTMCVWLGVGEGG